MRPEDLVNVYCSKCGGNKDYCGCMSDSKTAREILIDHLKYTGLNSSYIQLSHFADMILTDKDFLEAIARERFEIEYTLTADGINAYRKAEIKVKE